MKQTALEWLQEALEDTILTKEQIMQTIGLFEQAKEMEKEQITSAWDNGIQWEWDSSIRNSEEYYNTTFKSE